MEVYGSYLTPNILSGQAQAGNIHHQETGITPDYNQASKISNILSYIRANRESKFLSTATF